MAAFRPFALLWNDRGGRCRVWCDGRQNFVYETRNGTGVVERFRSNDPAKFHRYTYELCAGGWQFSWAPREKEDRGGNRDA